MDSAYWDFDVDVGVQERGERSDSQAIPSIPSIPSLGKYHGTVF
jgi:hypothetical protein